MPLSLEQVRIGGVLAALERSGENAGLTNRQTTIARAIVTRAGALANVTNSLDQYLETPGLPHADTLAALTDHAAAFQAIAGALNDLAEVVASNAPVDTPHYTRFRGVTTTRTF